MAIVPSRIGFRFRVNVTVMFQSAAGNRRPSNSQPVFFQKMKEF